MHLQSLLSTLCKLTFKLTSAWNFAAHVTFWSNWNVQKMQLPFFSTTTGFQLQHNTCLDLIQRDPWPLSFSRWIKSNSQICASVPPLVCPWVTCSRGYHSYLTLGQFLRVQYSKWLVEPETCFQSVKIITTNENCFIFPKIQVIPYPY